MIAVNMISLSPNCRLNMNLLSAVTCRLYEARFPLVCSESGTYLFALLVYTSGKCMLPLVKSNLVYVQSCTGRMAGDEMCLSIS